jgi:RNA polymerase sigma-70 factor (ECF subfamily)
MDDELRGLLFSIAYRMVGEAGDAEDLVQEAYLRLHQAVSAGTEIESRKAYLTTVVTRLAIDHLRSARVRREQYVGQWLPEPLIGEAGEPDPAEHAAMADSLSLAFLVVLETLSPVERAVFVLREVFDYGYDEIAEIIGRSEDNCRQIAARARRRIDAGKPRFEASREVRDGVAERFFDAFESGDVDGLLALLAGDVVFVGDGGGKATSFPAPLYGRERVGHALRAFSNQFRRFNLSIDRVLVNGQPGWIGRDPEGKIINVLSLDIADDAVQALRSVVNPDKLERIGPVSDLTRRRRRPG